jgi:hypothetical protein
MTHCFIEVDKQFVIDIELFDTSVAKKFLNQLKWHVSNSSINQRECFYGYAEEKVVQQNLLTAIDKINTFLKRSYITLPQYIDWDNHNFYNDLHQYFEKLNGEWGNPNLLMQVAPNDVKDAIRDLNFSIHRLETRPYDVNRMFYLSWDKNTYRREPLEEHEYELFTDTFVEGVVYLSYTEVGKHLKELYHDDLTPNYEAYKNLHYVGAEVHVRWDSTHEIFTDKFKQWAKQHDIDINDKKLGIGLMPVGTFKGSDKNFTKDSKVTNITIKED